MSLRGFDISEHQTVVPNVAGARWAILRGTYGIGFDARVDAHAGNVKKKGLNLSALYGFGVHFWFRGGQFVTGRSQAEMLVRKAEALKLRRICLDWEDDGPTRPQMHENEARSFIDRAIGLHGDCGLYASASQFRDLGQTWDYVAKWGSVPPSWHGWEFWQTAARYRGRNIDLDEWPGTEPELLSWMGGAPIPLPAPKPVPRPQDPELEDGDMSFNIAPAKTLRDARLKPGAVIFFDSALTHRQSRTEEGADLGFLGSGPKFHAVVNKGYARYVDRGDVLTTTIVNERTYA